MASYDVTTSALWEWSVDFGTILQTGILGNGDPNYPLELIINIFFRHHFDFDSGFEILSSIAEFFVMLALFILISATTVLAVFASMWTVWGYAISKMIGFMFIPTLLFDRLSFLFDGWLRFFFSFLLYQVILRANIALMVFGFMEFYDLPVDVSIADLEDWTWVITPGGWEDYYGIFIFLVIGLAGLKSTTGFVSSIVGGMNTGFGGIQGAGQRMLKQLM